MLAALLLFLLNASSRDPDLDRTLRPGQDRIVTLVPRSESVEMITSIIQARCACRASEVCVRIDGVPVQGQEPYIVVPQFRGIQTTSTSWVVLILSSDYWMRERVLSGEWIETRPRLRSAH
jgi:hypothetical protein